MQKGIVINSMSETFGIFYCGASFDVSRGVRQGGLIGLPFLFERGPRGDVMMSQPTHTTAAGKIDTQVLGGYKRVGYNDSR